MLYLYIILAVIAIVLIAAALKKPAYTVEKKITIKRPKAEVFDYIKYLQNQSHYNKWTMLDPNSKKEYRGTDGTVGFVYAWQSDNKQLGQGEQEIKLIKEGSLVDYELRFIKPFPSTARSYMLTEALNANETKVTWGFTGNRNYMMKLMHMLLNLKKMMGNALAESLINLKKVLEQQPVAA